jgi:PAS domain S-box-containing protein
MMNIQSPDPGSVSAAWKILIIDDDEDDFFIVSNMLKAARGRKFDVHWADSYAAGRKELFSNQYHAVLVDYDLGAHSGIELIREVTGQGCAAPLILFTGRGSYEVDLEAMQAGATLYLTKGETSSLMLERAIRYAIERKQIETTLRASEAKLRSVLKALVEGVVFLNPQGEIEEANEAVKRYYDPTLQDRSQPNSDPSPQIIRPDGTPFPVDEQPASLAMRAGQVVRDVEMGVPTQDGKMSWLLVNAQPVYDDRGALLGAVASSFDITDRKQAEEALRQTAGELDRRTRELNAILSSVQDYVYILDPDGRFVFANQKLLELWGLAAGQAAGKTMRDLSYPEVVETALLQGVKQVLATGQVVTNVTQYTSPTGATGSFENILAPMHGPDGAVAFVAGSSRDITERIRADLSLRESEGRFHALVTATSDVVYRMSPDWSEMLRLQGRDFIADTDAPSRTWLDRYIHPEDQPYVLAAIHEAIRTRSIFALEHRVIRLDGSLGWTFSRAVPRLDAQGEIVEWFGAASDITERKQAEEDLRASEKRYRNLFENMAEEVHFWQIVRDEAGRIQTWRLVDVNPPTLVTWGRASVDEIRGKTTDEIFGPGATEHFMPVVQKIMREGVPYSFEDYFPNLDKYFRFTSVPFGEYFITTGADITSAKQAGRAMALANERLQEQAEELEVQAEELQAQTEELLIANQQLAYQASLLDEISEAVISTSPSSEILSWNRAAEEMYGWQAEEVLGKPSDLFLWTEFLDGASTVDVIRQLEELGIWNGEVCQQRKDGTDIYVAASLTSLKDSAGKTTGVISINRDITERRQMEEALYAAHERAAWLARFPSENPDPVLRIAADGRVLYRNPAAARTPGWICEEDQHLPDAVGVVIAQAIEQREKTEVELELSGRVYAVSVMPFRSEGYFNLYAHDITERKAAQVALAETAKKLEQSNWELEQFALMASHDLQEPLRKIKLFGNSLQQKLQGVLDEGTQDSFQRMLSATGRMQVMIDDLLQLSRLNTEGMPFAPVDLSVVAAEVLSDLEPRIRRMSAQVIVEALPCVEADPIQIHQVLQNLIVNGLKFHKPGTPPIVKVSSTITSSPARKGELVSIRVEDNGIGFEEGQFEKILQPFQRLHSRSEYEGTGIGLAIVKKIIDRHQGEISARSTPGEGSTFIITLPVKTGLKTPPSPA